MTRRPQGLGDSAWAGLTSCLLNAKKKCVARSPESLLRGSCVFAATATTAIAAACIFVLGPLDFSHLVMLQQFHNTILLRRGHWDRIFPDFGMQCVSNCETMVRIIASSLHVCNSGSANRVLQKTGRFLNFGSFYIVLHHYIIPIHSTMF